MTTDQMGWLAVVVLIAGVVAGFLQYSAAAWVLVLAGIALILFAKMRS